MCVCGFVHELISVHDTCCHVCTPTYSLPKICITYAQYTHNVTTGSNAVNRLKNWANNPPTSEHFFQSVLHRCTESRTKNSCNLLQFEAIVFARPVPVHCSHTRIFIYVLSI